jgi:hypothetical protein
MPGFDIVHGPLWGEGRYGTPSNVLRFSEYATYTNIEIQRSVELRLIINLLHREFSTDLSALQEHIEDWK